MSSPDDPGNALIIRTQYRQSQSRAARLRLLVDTGQELSSLSAQAMGERASLLGGRFICTSEHEGGT